MMGLGALPFSQAYSGVVSWHASCWVGEAGRAGRRWSDSVSVGVLTRMFPPGLVDEVIAEVDRTEQRQRWLPALVTAYFAIGMGL